MTSRDIGILFVFCVVAVGIAAYIASGVRHGYLIVGRKRITADKNPKLFRFWIFYFSLTAVVTIALPF